MKPLITGVLLIFSFITGTSTETDIRSQQTTIEGVVKDSTNQKLLAGVQVTAKGLNLSTSTDQKGAFTLQIDNSSLKTVTLRFSYVGYESKEQKVALDAGIKKVEILLASKQVSSEEIMVTGRGKNMDISGQSYIGHPLPAPVPPQGFNTESYDHIDDNQYRAVDDYPLSTFSIDVDAASYSNMRRMINEGRLPVKDAIRIEELINYFDYDYPDPTDEHPFSINLESGESPWNTKHKLVQIGIQGKRMEQEELPPSNLVFLIDVSGSMRSPRKLPLLKNAFRLLVNQLNPEDKVAIVVYAGSSGLVLPSTLATEKDSILSAINSLRAGGSTAGAEGIQLAYKIAQENYREEGNNRVILATDGDFNVGISSDAELTRLIEEKRNNGVFLTTLGFGTGNLKDTKMEKLADKGNGNYAYIDNILEAKKVLVNEIGSTLLTIAKDVKIQVEFNPSEVQAYRLIGYVNRLLDKEDFNDDTKDAGELGAGHSVTALYEIIPAGIEADVEIPDIDSLKYQSVQKNPEKQFADELLNVKLRYKKPDEDESILLSQALKSQDMDEKLSEDLMFSSAVAGFGMLLRDSEYKGSCSYNMVLDMSKAAKGEDENGYRSEFIRLVETAKLLSENKVSEEAIE